MARTTLTITLNTRQITSDALRRGMAADKREAMRSGVILRAQTMPNRRRVADKQACRKGVRWD